MATRTKAQFEALYGTSGTTFPDNIIGSISEEDLRDFGQDIADSVFTSGFISTKVTIPSASILTAFTTPVTLVAAQGAGTFIEVIRLFMFLDYNSAAYATNTDIEIGINNGVATIASSILDQTNDMYSYFTMSNYSTLNNITNQPLEFSIQTGNPTAGNSPLYVYLTYRVITL